jgi:hypothetical protein
MRAESTQSRLVRAVPGLIVGASLVAVAAALLIAGKSGVSPRASREVTIGPVNVLLIYTTPSLTMVVAGVLTAVALVLLVLGVDAWAARRVTEPAPRPRQAAGRPLARKRRRTAARGDSR